MENTQGSSKMIILIVLLVAIILGGLYYFYFRQLPGAKKSQEQGVSRDLVTIGIQGDISGIYPDMEDEQISFEVNRHIFDTLVSLNEKLVVTPALAESWSSPDNLTWRLKLQKNVKFQDGSSFGPEDVKFTIEQALENKWASTASYLTLVQAVNKIDDNTVEIKTSEPDPTFLNKLANVLILSRNYTPEKNAAKPIGTGPYTLIEWVKNDHITLAANPNYYAGEPKVKKATFKVIETEKDRISALLAGQIDLTAYGYEEDATPQIQADTNLDVRTSQSLSVTILVLNTLKDDSPFKNLKVRQAVYQALDINKIIKQVMGGGQPATQLVSDIVFGYNPNIQRLTYDPEKAKTSLQEAGFTNGFEVTLDDSKGAEKVDQEIVNELAAVGIKVNQNLMDRETAYEKILKKKDTVFLKTSWSSDTGDADLGTMFHTPDEEGNYGALNMGYSNKDLDALIEQANVVTDKSERLKILQEAMQVVTDDIAYIPLYIVNTNYGVTKSLVWQPRPDRLVFVFEMAGKK